MQDTIDQVKETVRQVGESGDPEGSRHVGAAGIPGHQR